MHKILILLAASAALLSANAFAVDRGELLASSCMSCHGPGGKSKGAIPSLAGLEKGYFVTSMQNFKSGARPASVMHRHAKGYTDAEYALMGEYFSKLK
ncbi:c-type cytochrome [Betaproteobacteria bacterium SCN2]|jgi:cytochrome c553|nr:c-type cytochrome [Betaproteobacteria bacterium SCN2]